MIERHVFIDLDDMLDYVVTHPKDYTFTVTTGKRRHVGLNKSLWHLHTCVCALTGDSKERQHLRFKEEVVVPYIDTHYPELELANTLEFSKQDPNMVTHWDEDFPSAWYMILKNVRTRDLEHEEFQDCIRAYNEQIIRRGIVT